MILIHPFIEPNLKHSQNIKGLPKIYLIDDNKYQYCKSQQNNCHYWRVLDFNCEKLYFFQSVHNQSSQQPPYLHLNSFQSSPPQLQQILRIFYKTLRQAQIFSFQNKPHQGNMTDELIYQHLSNSCLTLLSLIIPLCSSSQWIYNQRGLKGHNLMVRWIGYLMELENLEVRWRYDYHKNHSHYFQYQSQIYLLIKAYEQLGHSFIQLTFIKVFCPINFYYQVLFTKILTIFHTIWKLFLYFILNLIFFSAIPELLIQDSKKSLQIASRHFFLFIKCLNTFSQACFQSVKSQAFCFQLSLLTYYQVPLTLVNRQLLTLFALHLLLLIQLNQQVDTIQNVLETNLLNLSLLSVSRGKVRFGIIGRRRNYLTIFQMMFR